MTIVSQVVNQLHAERKKVHGELSRLDAAIQALQGLGTTNGSGMIHRVSASARRKMSLAQKARWARRSAKVQAATAAPKRKISASARRRIAAAQKARWAAWRAKQKKAA